jgi:hypothetical protein
MIIFHSFKDRSAADDFAKWTTSTAKRSAIVCGTQSESNQIEGFLFPLNPPIVLIDQPPSRHLTDAAKRKATKAEKKVIDMAYKFGGSIASVIQ